MTCKKGLKEIGLTEGETFDRLALDRVQQELIRQYYNRGKYNVSVIPHVTQLDRNRVAIDIEIREGKVAKMKEVNIVGNTAFATKDIEDNFESGTTNWLSWYSKNDQYSQDKLSGDLKKLQSYYMDRGYADFGLDSSQVTISPDKRAMYITADVVQGEIYHISDTHLLGQLILPEDTLRKLVFVHNGDLFNRAAIEATSNAIKALLANIGYAFAKVNSVPKLDKDKHTADITWYIQPGARVYVRRVIFQGNTRTEDDVLRREMRQLEGAWYSQAAIDRSKIRLQQLGFFKTVTIDKQVVPGSDDEVDLTVKVEEQSAGSLTFGVGYSQYSGIILSSSVSQNNFLGTGDRFSVSAERSDYLTQISASYYNPYLTDNAIGIGYNASFSRADYSDLGSQYASYSNSTKSFSTTLGFPVTDFDRLSGTLGIGSTKINTYAGYTPQVLVDYINALGHETIHTWTGSLGWVHDTRNSYWAPTHGGQLTATVMLLCPAPPCSTGPSTAKPTTTGRSARALCCIWTARSATATPMAARPMRPPHRTRYTRRDSPISVPILDEFLRRWRDRPAWLPGQHPRSARLRWHGCQRCSDQAIPERLLPGQHVLLRAADRWCVQGAGHGRALPAAAVPQGHQYRARVVVRGRRPGLRQHPELQHQNSSMPPPVFLCTGRHRSAR